jgi:hypothetical protein
MINNNPARKTFNGSSTISIIENVSTENTKDETIKSQHYNPSKASSSSTTKRKKIRRKTSVGVSFSHERYSSCCNSLRPNVDYTRRETFTQFVNTPVNYCKNFRTLPSTLLWNDIRGYSSDTPRFQLFRLLVSITLFMIIMYSMFVIAVLADNLYTQESTVQIQQTRDLLWNILPVYSNKYLGIILLGLFLLFSILRLVVFSSSIRVLVILRFVL